MDKTKIEAGISLVLEGMGVDLSDHNFDDTPRRYADAVEELFAQPNRPPTSFEESYTNFVTVRAHEMYTLCPHHLLPVRMLVSVAYIPDGKVLGLSKLVRVMQQANNGPVMQERFTYEVRNRLEKALESDGELNQQGIAVHVEGWHGCMQLRGVRSHASTITEAYSGAFDEDPEMLNRFLLLVRGGR